jgi:hypothetical protein
VTTRQIVVQDPRFEDVVAALGAAPGLNLREVEPLTTLLIRTRNSVYRITVTGGSAVFVQGGRLFPEATAALLEGASRGGGLLRVGCIALGCCLEMRVGDRRIVTSPVCSMASERNGSRCQ